MIYLEPGESLHAWIYSRHLVRTIVKTKTLDHIIRDPRLLYPQSLSRRVLQHIQTRIGKTRHFLLLEMLPRSQTIRPVPHGRDHRIPIINGSLFRFVPQCVTPFGCWDVDALQVAHEATAGSPSEKWSHQRQTCAYDPARRFDQRPVNQWGLYPCFIKLLSAFRYTN